MINDEVSRSIQTCRRTFRQDVVALLRACGPDATRLLARRLDEGRVIRGCYHSTDAEGRPTACIVGWLVQVIDSRSDLLRLGPLLWDSETLMAARRLVRLWDLSQKDDYELRSAIAEALAEFKAIERSIDLAECSDDVLDGCETSEFADELVCVA